MPRDRVFKIRPAPVILTRALAAPRGLAWEAWRAPAHLTQWFAPDGFSIAEADIDFRTGGAFSLRLMASDGHELLSQGKYTEILAPDRIAFLSRNAKFSCETQVTFDDHGPGTMLTIRQDYEVYAPGYLAVAAGASDAWQSTLDKLEKEVEAISV